MTHPKRGTVARVGFALGLGLAAHGCYGRLGALEPDRDAAPDRPPPAPATSFATTTDLPELLPFRVRLARVAAVAGVSTADPILDELLRRRHDLGDYDYAAGVAPDHAWSSLRIATWAGALRSVCDSEAMRARYPSLPEAAPALVQAAYGRAIDADDRAAIGEVVASVGAIEPASRYRAVCLAVLSSLEFVAR